MSGFGLIELIVAVCVLASVSLYVAKLYRLSWQNSYFAASMAEASIVLADITEQQLLLPSVVNQLTHVPSRFTQKTKMKNGMLNTCLSWHSPLKPIPHQLSIDVVRHVQI